MNQKESSKSDRKAQQLYRTPKLVRYGSVSKLTAKNSSGADEQPGQKTYL